jgi:hypothetical protein
VKERRITDDDRRVLNERLNIEAQFQWVDSQVRRHKRELDIMEKLRGTVAHLRERLQDEIEMRDLGPAWKSFLTGGGLERGL